MVKVLSAAAVDRTAQPMIAVRAQPPAFSQVTQIAGTTAIQPVSAKAAPVAGVTPDIAAIRYISPDFAQKIIAIRPGRIGVPRSQITVPIAPNANFTDAMLFEAPADPNQKYYVPAYQVAADATGTTGPGPGNRYRISLAQEGSGWVLRVFLQKFAPAALGDGAKSAQELPHRVSILLRHNQLMGGQAASQEELAFSEVTAAQGGLLQAVLRVTTLAERDELYRALTETAYGAALVVRRAVTVAIPAPVIQLEPPPSVPQPQPVGPIRRPPIFIRRDMAISEMRTNVQIANLATQPQTHPPPEPLFRQVDRVFDWQVDPKPFAFVPALHGYIFGGIAPASGPAGELIRREAAWTDGRTYSYYQDPVRRHIFSFLPDTFKLARRPDGQHEPLVSVRFDSADGSIDNIKTTFAYIAVPFVNPDRLQAASEILKTFIDALPQGVTGPQFEPLLPPPDKTHLKLAYPGAQTTGGPYELRPAAIADLRSGISDSLSMSLASFQAAFTSLCGDASAQVSGAVSFDMGDIGEQIPFTFRFGDAAGDVLLKTQSALAGNTIPVSLRNIIESPVQITSLTATILSGTSSIPAQLQGVDLKNPIKVAPGDSISIVATAGDGTTLDAGATVHFDLSGVTVQSDETAIWNAVLDPGTPAVYSQEIKVKTFAAIFDATASASERLQEIVVDIENGPTVELTPAQLESTIKINHPLANYVLQKGDLTQYRYKLTFVRLSGQAHDADWRTANSGVLIITGG